MIHSRSLVFFILFLPGVARRSIQLGDTFHDSHQQTNTVAKSRGVSVDAREALLPWGLGELYRRQGPQAGALRAENRQGPQLRAPRGEIPSMLAGRAPKEGALFINPYDEASLLYEPLRRYPDLFDPAKVAEAWLHPEFLQLSKAVRDADLMDTEAATIARAMVTKEGHNVYSFPLLREEVCDQLIEEVDNFQSTGLPARRPNSMNNYGLILNEIGLKPALSALQQAVQPVARALFPLEGDKLDDHHSFVVSYKPSEDRGLDMHSDDSDVTLNVCLGKQFEASGLTFCGDQGTERHRLFAFRYEHVRGRGLLHLGRRRHGADDISAGHRVNLIMWNYNRAYRLSKAYRMRPYQKEPSAPDAVCVSFTHDRDYEAITGRDRGPGNEKFAKTAWCPPRVAEYPGFQGMPGRYGANR